MFTTHILAVLMLAAPELPPTLSAVSSGSVEGYTFMHGEENSYLSFFLMPGGELECAGQMGYEAKGSWRMTGGRIRGNCQDVSFDYDHVVKAGTSIFSVHSQKRRFTFVCNENKNCSADDEGGATYLLVGVIPGGKDTRNFEAALRKAATLDTRTDGYKVVYVQGPPAKNPREDSELWWSDAGESAADHVGGALESAIGSTEPAKKWTYGTTAYDVLVIVGSSTLRGGPVVRVKLMDGKCTGASACTNPMMTTVREKLESGVFQVVAQGKAKTPRGTMEVWYRAGKKPDAVALIEEFLKTWTSSAEVKEWKWGGDFDVLIVVPAPK